MCLTWVSVSKCRIMEYLFSKKTEDRKIGHHTFFSTKPYLLLNSWILAFLKQFIVGVKLIKFCISVVKEIDAVRRFLALLALGEDIDMDGFIFNTNTRNTRNTG